MSLEDRIRELNERQRDSVDSIIRGWEGRNGEFILPMVEGPPGTGKTTVGVLASGRYRQEATRPQITYLCYTHYAADRALESFIELGLSPQDVVRIVDLGKRQTYENSANSAHYVFLQDETDLSDNSRRLLRRTPILITTLHSVKKAYYFQNQPLILIDEFSQVSPTLYFSTISKLRTNSNPSGYTLLGDPNQLPVITTQALLRPNIGSFIMSRKSYEPHQLNLQYRMHTDICGTVNALRAALNSYPLETHPSAENRDLNVLGYNWNKNHAPIEFHEILDYQNPCVIINTDNLPGNEEVGPGGSKYFDNEAVLAARIATALYDSYTINTNIHLLPTLLSPYQAQIGMIRNHLNTNLQRQCTTIYKSQGREYPCVIISFARKNPGGLIGFLGEPQMRAQTYVACSRAQAKLIVLFSFSTFRGYLDFDYLLERSNNVLIINADSNWIN